MLEITVNKKLKELGAFLYYGIAIITNVDCNKDMINDFVNMVENYIRNKYLDASRLKEVIEIKMYRKFLWRLKIDPTKLRPSSEALARRILRGSKMPRINDIVDIGNVVSAYTLVPIGLYDLEKVHPPLVLTISKGGELFINIDGRVEMLREGIPIMIDSENKVLHIYPHRDSRETSVTSDIRRLLVVGAGVDGISEEQVRNSVSMVLESLQKYGCSTESLGPWRSR